MGNSNRRFSAVYVLPASTTGAIDINTQISRINIYLDIIIDLGGNENRGK